MKKTQSDWSKAYDQKNVKKISVKINKTLEPELFDWVTAQKNMSGYIKELIREDMKKQSH